MDRGFSGFARDLERAIEEIVERKVAEKLKGVELALLKSMPRFHGEEKEKKRLTPQEAAEFLGVNVQTLANWRSNQLVKLPYLKQSGRVMYRREDLETFVAAGLVEPG